MKWKDIIELLDMKNVMMCMKGLMDFFEEVKNEIGIKKDRPSEFEIRLCCPIGKTAEYEIHTLEDKIHMLLYRDKVVAVVTETRDTHNYLQFDFFKNIENLLR